MSTQNDLHRLKTGSAGFEDGTPNYLAAAALPDGLALLHAVGIPALHRHVMRLTSRPLDGLTALRHGRGAPCVRVHGPATLDRRGATVAFNITDTNGRVIPYAHLEDRARTAGISVRGGCFCNPGASEHAFGFSAALARTCMERGLRSEEFSIARLAECMPGVPIGALRASFGIPSNDRDVERLIEVVSDSARHA